LQDVLVEQEGPQILQWLIEGAQKYLKDGLKESAVILATTKAYEEEEDTLGQFIDECCLVAPNASISGKLFRERYVEWCEDNGYKPYGTKQLTQRLQSHKKYKVEPGRIDAKTRGFKGITISEPLKIKM